MNEKHNTLVIDCFPYNGELVALFRVQYLYKHVDRFVVIEARQTYSGKQKEALEFHKNRIMFEPYMDKITYVVIDEFPEPDPAWLQAIPSRFPWMAESSYDSWWREMYQREYGERYIREHYLHTRALVICSDADEIPREDAIVVARNMYDEFSNAPVFLEMKFFYYNFRWCKNQDWYYAFIINTTYLANHPLFQTDGETLLSSFSEIRVAAPRTRVMPMAGWHCSYFASKEDLKRKLESFSHREFDREEFKTSEYLEKCINNGKDIANRGPSEDCRRFDDPSSLPRNWQTLQQMLVLVQS